MEPPAPINTVKSIHYSIITIIWWLGIWGLLDTIMTHFFKDKSMYKLFFYLGLITSIVILTKIDPTISEYL